MSLPFAQCLSAHQRITPFIHRTPVLSSTRLNRLVNAELLFKCENFQKGGSFKARGAFNVVHSLDHRQLQNGLVTHSSGNHAAAVALAAASRQAKAHVVMPENASLAKKSAVRSYGGILIECPPTLAARERCAQKVLAETNGLFLHPYDDKGIIAGQGTAALELIEETGQLDAVLCPVGGGGLLAGVAIVSRALQPKTAVVAAEPAGADDAKRSFESGHLVPQTDPNTMADGLLTSLGTLNFAIIQRKVDRILTVSEANIVRAMRLIWQYLKIVIEPSSAVPLGALLEHPCDLKGARVGVILTGGNVDLDRLPW